MLFNKLNQVMSQIDSLDPQKEAPILMRELKRVSPEYWEHIRDSMKKKGNDDKLIDYVEKTIALGVLKQIKEIPVNVKELVKLVKAPETHAAYRCALVGILALIVKKKDLIPDDAPGGYGFIDDLILLHASIILYLNALPVGVKSLDEESKNLEFLMIAVPPRDHVKMQTAIAAMTYGCQVLASLPPDLLDNVTQQVIQNPELTELSPPPDNIHLTNVPELPKREHIYDWGGGITCVDGDNINITFSDGGSATLLENGDLFVQTD